MTSQILPYPMLYDALSNSKFSILKPGTLTIYVCGVTVYDLCHVGHGRVKVVFDVLRRYLIYLGQDIKFVTNITDIDDKIIAKANANNIAWHQVVDRFLELMQEDDRELGIMNADISPRATEFIPEMIELIHKLFMAGHAYIADNGDVCFSVNSFVDYGKLSKQKLEELKSSEESEGKKDVADFVLWKKSKVGEPYWESPWGHGRPGWHLECSAMVKSCLGQPIDIHAGGLDLKFPHHENECAQSECAYESQLARHWMYIGLIDNNGIKMSKSLNNTVSLRAALAAVGPNVLRLFYLKTHYSQPLSWSDDALHEAKVRWERYVKVCNIPVLEEDVDMSLWQKWLDAMADDMNTSLALMYMDQWAKLALTEEKPCYVMLIKKALNLFGCTLNKEYNQELIHELIAARQKARSHGDYKLADALRDKLSKLGVIVEDSAIGMKWYRI